MGGSGSNRWMTTVTRPLVDGMLRLDVRALARAGGLVPGAGITVAWNSGASVTAHLPIDDPSCLMLVYEVCDRSGAHQSITESIPLLSTPGTFGGTRDWFGCPGCRRRCAVLYALGGCFRCRECHRLAYASSRRHAVSTLSDAREYIRSQGP